MRRAVGGIAVALLLAASATRGAGAQDRPSAAQDDVNHAAVVIDTGDGTVRKLCLTFPEAEISGIEALRRVDTRPHRFETFNGKGSGVCMLCGVGCESGDCFCSRTNYWAYHRAGPGETSYRTSSLGASNTVVRDGDVEAWKWGTGSAPVKTTVSEVCQVPEPPSRTGSAPTTTSPEAEQPPTTTAVSQPPGQPTPTPTPVIAPTTTRAARPAAITTSTTEPHTTEVTEAPQETQAEQEAAAPAAAEVKRSLGAEEGSAEAEQSQGTSAAQRASLAAFAALIAALLVWRSRLRRAKVRRARPVR